MVTLAPTDSFSIFLRLKALEVEFLQKKVVASLAELRKYVLGLRIAGECLLLKVMSDVINYEIYKL